MSSLAPYSIRRGPSSKHPNAYDVETPEGVEVYAPEGRSREVTYSGFARRADGSASYGELIVLDHHLYYAHLSKRLVKRGQRVRGITLLGLTGNTGRSEGPHLHFEDRQGKPALWLPLIWRPNLTEQEIRELHKIIDERTNWRFGNTDEYPNSIANIKNLGQQMSSKGVNGKAIADHVRAGG